MGTGEPLNLAIRKLHQCFHIPIKKNRKTSPVNKTLLNISLCRQSRTEVMRRSARGFTGSLDAAQRKCHPASLP